MRPILKVAPVIIAALFFCAPSSADTSQSVVVSNCGTPPVTYTAGQAYPDTQDTKGNKCQNGSGGNTPAPLAAGSATNRGGSVTVGGTSQTLAAANASRKALCIENPATATSQNIAAAESLFVNVNNIAATLNSTTSYEILPGGSTCLTPPGLVDQTAVTVNATTTGHQFLAKEY